MSEQHEDEPFVTRIGPISIDWPRTVGYYGGIGLAVGLELIAPGLALFIAAVPLLKLLKRKNATLGERAFASLFEGAAKPVGGDCESTIQPTWEADEQDQRAAQKQLTVGAAGSPLRAARSWAEHARVAVRGL